MSEEGDDDSERSHEPTQKKLEDARRKGDIPRSQDLNTAAAYLGLLVAFALAPEGIRRLGDASMALLSRADTFGPLLLSGAPAPYAGLLFEVGAASAPMFLVPALFVLATVLVQRNFVVTGENLQPKLSRVSLIAQAKNRFGRNGLFEFAKSTVKLIVVSAVLAIHLARESETILSLAQLPSGMVAAILAQQVAAFLWIVLGVAVVFGFVDLMWQRAEHIRRNRMTHKELMDELKESEGDPYLKQERRRRGIDIAMNRMLAEVPKADVVVVNPTHYAVALKWSREAGTAPVCVAKGVDEVAARIRTAAAEAGVPIHRDPPTARALYATVDLGEEIRRDHYRAVAAAIRFAERMRARARNRRRPETTA